MVAFAPHLTIIEITSPGYEAKDLEEGPFLYLMRGVRDVVVLDRRSMQVHPWSDLGHTVGPSPRRIRLAVDCLAVV